MPRAGRPPVPQLEVKSQRLGQFGDQSGVSLGRLGPGTVIQVGYGQRQADEACVCVQQPQQPHAVASPETATTQRVPSSRLNVWMRYSTSWSQESGTCRGPFSVSFDREQGQGGRWFSESLSPRSVLLATALSRPASSGCS